MAVYKLFPTADATIYSGYSTMNTGLDEILEASSNYKTSQLQVNGTNPQASRFLIKFNQAEIQSLFSSNIKAASWQANLRCFVANSTGLSNTTTLNINALAEDWAMGTGKFLDSPETANGVSWVYKSYSGSNPWTTSGFASGILRCSWCPSSSRGATRAPVVSPRHEVRGEVSRRSPTPRRPSRSLPYACPNHRCSQQGKCAYLQNVDQGQAQGFRCP